MGRRRALRFRRISPVFRDRWVALKKELAADGFVVTYWCSLEDDVLEDVAA